MNETESVYSWAIIENNSTISYYLVEVVTVGDQNITPKTIPVCHKKYVELKASNNKQAQDELSSLTLSI